MREEIKVGFRTKQEIGCSIRVDPVEWREMFGVNYNISTVTKEQLDQYMNQSPFGWKVEEDEVFSWEITGDIGELD